MGIVMFYLKFIGRGWGFGYLGGMGNSLNFLFFKWKDCLIRRYIWWDRYEELFVVW